MGIGVGVMVMKGDKILLGHRHPDPEKASSDLQGQGTWTFPGGKVDFGETIKSAAERELIEETGIKSVDLEIFSITDDIKGSKHYLTAGFICKKFEGEPKAMEPQEITEWKFFELNNLPKPLFFPTEKMIKNYLAKKTYYA